MIHKPFFLYILLCCLGFCTSCATAPTIQPQINSLVIAQRYTNALNLLSEHKEGYGANNRLLYLFDQGYILQLSGHYDESIAVFEQAKQLYQELYTQSVTKLSLSWFWNDYMLSYRGEDFERVLINIFQALNYALQGDIEEALVEARDVDVVLTGMNARYQPDQKNGYKEDAFARFLMGILYESSGSAQDFNDALISYEKAIKTYTNDYKYQYSFTEIPHVLKENFLTIAEFMGEREFSLYRKRFADTSFMSLSEKRQKGELYIIHYVGLSPKKISDTLIIPLPEGHFARFSFPRYVDRSIDLTERRFLITDTEGQEIYVTPELVEDISAIAKSNLEDRKLRIYAKTITRSLGKYFFTKTQVGKLGKRRGKKTARWYHLASTMLNIYSEQADLRSWQTLPGQIRLGRLILSPGEYEIALDNQLLGHIKMKKGEKKFFIIRSVY